MKAQPGTDAPPEHKSVLETHGYTIAKTIGHGSYATVKEAYSESHKCKVAVKIISKRRAPADYLHKFLPREVNVIKMLKHPNIILFLQSIETNQRVYIVIEFAPRGDLLDLIREQGSVDERQAGIWFYQLIDGMEYCHSKGVVHRDLKCENLLLDEHNNLKITDFGFARNGMKPVNGKFPLSQTYCGSYAYASPEILSGVPHVPQMSDIWSMGVILYVMVFGKLPFDDSNHKKLLKEVSNGPSFPSDRLASSDCKRLITKMLARIDIRVTIPLVQADAWFRRTTPPIAVTTKTARSRTSLTQKLPDDPTANLTMLPDSVIETRTKSSTFSF